MPDPLELVVWALTWPAAAIVIVGGALVLLLVIGAFLGGRP